ncbi:MAG TPA: DUF4382 domain-containing protein [Bacteroidales bacterium]|nr:DUF4382 domain-containing protein [Bacteroidales bacterium]
MKKCLFLLLSAASVLLFACTKDGDQNVTMKVHLTDAPGDYEQVLIDIQDLQIHVTGDGNENGWQSLPVEKGVYNLLDFRNGMDALLATTTLPAGKISQMRLVLGSNNQIKKEGTLYNLETPSAQQSGLKFNIDATLTEGITYELWIDFDAARSIVENGSNQYILRPVIRTFTKATSGAIKGVVSPAEALPVVKAIANGDTVTTIASEDGNFLLQGLNAGTWKVTFEPVEPYGEKTISNIGVSIGDVTPMDTVKLLQAL